MACFSNSCDCLRSTRWARKTRSEASSHPIRAVARKPTDGSALPVSTVFVDLLPLFRDTARHPATILSTHFTIALHLPSSLPHISLCALGVVQQSESWPAESRRLPGAEELTRSSWEVLLASSSSDEKAALLRAALAGSSLETKRAALSRLEVGPSHLLWQTASGLYRVALEEDQAGDVRAQAATLLHAVPPSTFVAEFAMVAAAHRQTPIVPLREALLPVIASMASSEDERAQALRLVEQASGVNEVRLPLQSPPSVDAWRLKSSA